MMSDNHSIIYRSALAAFRDKKILMVRNHYSKGMWFTVGGKVEPGESSMEALLREVREELSVSVKEESVKLLGEFVAPSYGRQNTDVVVTLYQGELIGTPKPSNEISEFDFFDSSIDEVLLTPVTVKIFSYLKEKGLIN